MNYKNYNDYELIYMVRENDDISRKIILQKYLPIIKSLTNEYYQKFKYYGYDYDDFLQEAHIAFQKAIVKYDELKESLFYTFVVICIRRRLLTFCRNISNSNKNISLVNTVEIDNCNVLDEKMNIDRLIDDAEVQNIIHKAIIDLPIHISSILELKINGFTYNEISNLLNIPCSTVEFRNRVAKKKLKKMLNNYFCNNFICK